MYYVHINQIISWENKNIIVNLNNYNISILKTYINTHTPKNV